MVDIAIVTATAWGFVNGWVRGFQKTLFNAISWMVSMLFLSQSIPFIQDHLLDSGFRKIGSNTITNKRDIEVATISTSGSSSHYFMSIEWYIIVLLCALSLFVGMQMIGYVFQVSRQDEIINKSSRWAGSLIGFSVTLLILVDIIQITVPLSWIVHKEWIDEYINHSTILHSLYILFPW